MSVRVLDFWKLVGIAGLSAFCFVISAAGSNHQHPFVLIDEKELATLQGELASGDWKSEVYRAHDSNSMNSGHGIRANADAWLNRKIEIPKRGGHFHNFFCEDGNQLELPKEQAFVSGPYRCPKCGRMYDGEKYEAALRRMVHVWLSKAALDLALVSAIERKSEYAQKAAEILLRYAEEYPGPHTSSLDGGMIYQSLDESMWVIPLAQAYDLIYANLNDDEREKIENFLRIVASGIQKCGTHGNWGSWHLSAVGVVGYAIGDKKLIGWATEQFKSQIRDQLGDDGLWPESVHTYHFFPLVAFIDFAEAARHAATDLYDWQAKPGKSLMAMFIAPLGYAYPDLRLPAINDGWFGSFLPPDLYELAYYRTKDPRFGWVLANGYRNGVVPAGVAATDPNGGRNGLYAFLFGKEIPTDVTAPAKVSVNFPVLGICALRSTNGALMTFDYGPYLGHGQRDKMGITLFANKKLWLADYGTPGYGATILGWYESTFAHNTIVVDGKNQQPTRENRARLWLNDPLIEGAESETKEAYPGVTHRRTVVRMGDYFVVRDFLSSESNHVYDFYLHSEGSLSLKNLKPTTKSAQSPNPWISSLMCYTSTKTISANWAAAGEGIAFWLKGASRMELLVGECPAETGTRKIPLLIARQRGKAAEFIAVFLPCRELTDWSVKEDSGKLWVQYGHKRDIITLPVDGEGPSVLRRSGF